MCGNRYKEFGGQKLAIYEYRHVHGDLSYLPGSGPAFFLSDSSILCEERVLCYSTIASSLRKENEQDNAREIKPAKKSSTLFIHWEIRQAGCPHRKLACGASLVKY